MIPKDKDGSWLQKFCTSAPADIRKLKSLQQPCKSGKPTLYAFSAEDRCLRPKRVKRRKSKALLFLLMRISNYINFIIKKEKHAI